MDDERRATGRLTRRRFLGLAAGAAGLAGAAAAACSGGSKKNPPPRASAAGSTSSASAALPSGTARAGSSQRGETLTYTGYVASDGVYDPHKTFAPPFYGQQAMVFSRLLSYTSQADGSLAPDLATSQPEQPDAQTLVFHVNPNARWHDRAPLNGRLVTADDIKFSFDRQTQGDASFVRKAEWANIDSITASDPQTVTFKMKAPMAAMVEGFAAVNAFVVAPELVANGASFTLDTQIGSGPFRWVDWSEGHFASVSRNPRWHGGGDRPFLDGVNMMQPKNASEIEAWLRTKKLDAAFVVRSDADRLKKAVPELQESTIGHSLFFGMRFFVGAAPFDDQRLRTALSIALDRRDMLQRFFDGSGDVNPWVSWPVKRWTLPHAELVTMPGYRPGTDGRDADIKDARALLAAYTGDKKLPATLNLFVLDEAETNLKMGSTIRDQLKAALDLPVTVYPVTLKQLGAAQITSEYTWAAGQDIGWVDLDDWVYPYFHSSGTRNTFALRDPDLDKLIEAQRAELDETKRRAVGYDIQRKLLALNAGVNFVSETVVALRRSYVREFPLDIADGYQHRFADCWIDRTDPDFRGR